MTFRLATTASECILKLMEKKVTFMAMWKTAQKNQRATVCFKLSIGCIVAKLRMVDSGMGEE